MTTYQRRKKFLAATCFALSAATFATIALAQKQAFADRAPITSLNNVQPSDFQYQTLLSLSQKYGCNLNLSQLNGQRSLTRQEFASGLSVCLDKINELISAGLGNRITPTDMTDLRRLQEEFAAELASGRGRLDALEAKTTKLEAQQFSTTTKLNATAVFGSTSQIRQTPPLSQPRPVLPPVGNLSVSSPASERAGRTQSTITSGSNQISQGIVSTENYQVAQDKSKPNVDRELNTENYSAINDNPFYRVSTNPLSTFAVDVDTASYSNIRRFLSGGQLPPKDAVRIEEMINYFSYNYPEPENDRPFSVTTEVGNAPWNEKHKLVLVGLQGKRFKADTIPSSNLVFLIDVSGSMNEPNKLPLVKESLRLLVKELSPRDRVSMVVYAGNAGLVLPSTSGYQKEKILAAIDNLEAGGSTAGGAGIQLAYNVAKQNFLKNGNNRVILATDGDFNVGVSSNAEMERLIEQKRQDGIFLTVLGFGTGNYKDDRMELLANKGNGNYAYIDTLMEAKKVLITDIRATLFTIAKDVKIQVEFNPNRVQAYRLIGYENRLLRDQDFNDDKKDAGEIGSGHSVTALYEIVPTGIISDVKLPTTDPLRYQTSSSEQSKSNSSEWLTVKLRYKEPDAETSQAIAEPVTDNRYIREQPASNNLRFATAVAAFGMVLRDSQYKGSANLDLVLRLAKEAKGSDREGYRSEFIGLIEKYRSLTANQLQYFGKQ